MHRYINIPECLFGLVDIVKVFEILTHFADTKILIDFMHMYDTWSICKIKKKKTGLRGIRQSHSVEN